MQSINFCPGNYHSNLLLSRRQSTIRLGDKTNKYTEGDIIWITIGKPGTKRKKIFTGVIERILVKKISQLTMEDLHGENPEMTTFNELIAFLSLVYDQYITEDYLVSVIFFSEVID